MTRVDPDDGAGSARRLDVELDLARSTERFAEARIMVVDDDPAIVRLVATVLQMAGATDVHGVTDPRQAVRRCRDLRPDLLVLDLHMGAVVGGLDVLAALGEDGEATSVVVLSGDTNPDARSRALRSGAADFIAKPFDVVDLLRRLRLVLESRTLHHSDR